MHAHLLQEHGGLDLGLRELSAAENALDELLHLRE